jgi:hypothetical protein
MARVAVLQPAAQHTRGKRTRRHRRLSDATAIRPASELVAETAVPPHTDHQLELGMLITSHRRMLTHTRSPVFILSPR